MPVWPFWFLFLSVGAASLLIVRRLDDAPRRTPDPWARPYET